MRQQEVGGVGDTDDRRFYNLEAYLFGEVSQRYEREGKLSAFDFFCIVIWKANRAKSRIADLLLAKGYDDLEAAVLDLIAQTRNASSSKLRLQVLIKDRGFRLPMASAVLSVLYPEEFTVYDVRVCDVLGGFRLVQHKVNFESLWEGYSTYVAAVSNAGTKGLSLRDRDRLLWGRSFANELRQDIRGSFPRRAGERDDDA